ncbi:hypothetical protein ECPA5_2817, partial [Escherichia coli PA5]
MIIFILTSS